MRRPQSGPFSDDDDKGKKKNKKPNDPLHLSGGELQRRRPEIPAWKLRPAESKGLQAPPPDPPLGPTLSSSAGS